jgi:hypothetical protein
VHQDGKVEQYRRYEERTRDQPCKVLRPPNRDARSGHQSPSRVL